MNLNQLIGIGLRSPHYDQVLEEQPAIGWFEVHSENFFNRNGLSLAKLHRISEMYKISLHGVGLSLGSAVGIDKRHLARIKNLKEFVNPFLISEHLSWGSVDGYFVPDLLPVPYTDESLRIMVDNINLTQDYLQTEILIENPSSYIEYQTSYISEVEFLVTLCRKTGASILLDVNNIFVSAANHGWNAFKYIDAIPREMVKEIHIAGHTTKVLSSNQTIHIDTHNDFVSPFVWELYAYAIARFGQTLTLLEWDSAIPSFQTLVDEAAKALVYLSPDAKVVNE